MKYSHDVYMVKLFFNSPFDIDEDYQTRYIVAESEDEAMDKITAHYEMMSKLGYAKPVYISDPILEIPGVII